MERIYLEWSLLLIQPAAGIFCHFVKVQPPRHEGTKSEYGV